MAPTRIIVNADDLGLNAQVNEATFDLMAARRLRSATLIANGPCLSSAVHETRHFRLCSFGVHLNISELEPLTRVSDSGPLLDQSGQLTRWNLHRMPSPAFLRAAYLEFCAQVERLLAMGIAVSHIDSHHHAHTVPYVLPLVKAVQRRYRIRRIRIGKNIYTRSHTPSRALLCKKFIYNSALRRLYWSTTTDGFTEFTSLHEVATQKLLWHQAIEAMVHPGALSDRAETALLKSPWEHDLKFPVTQISYHELGADR